jgi:ribosomal protein S18 acetylase RimI-like enzyme
MRIEPFRTDDIEPFLGLAAAENWVAESWEFEFLLSEFPQGCFAVRSDSGEAAGFVTSLRHERSGWIGNLIVPAEYRGQGIGESLFLKALDALWAAGMETVWLTASKSGMPLYQKFGFNSVDTIIRWVGTGRQRHATHETAAVCDNRDLLLNAIDDRSWGDRRAALLAATAGRGRTLQQESGFVVVQPCGDALQIGPFSALDESTADALQSTADALLKAVLQTIPRETKVYLDAPASNRSALRLFNRTKLRISGSNELMYAGVKPAYKPEYLYGLATMGSCG